MNGRRSLRREASARLLESTISSCKFQAIARSGNNVLRERAVGYWRDNSGQTELDLRAMAILPCVRAERSKINLCYALEFAGS
jgi:hypothetical protein